MTNKRFIKLAMSVGIQRNEALCIAQTVLDKGSYKTLYKRYSLSFAIKRLNVTLYKVGTTAKKAIDTFKSLGDALRKIDNNGILRES